jgi:hypothetical protein
MTIKDYVEGLFGDIPDSKEKEDIMQEIIMNLDEKVQDLMEQGKEQEDAINKSIVDFGDATEIKKSLMPADMGLPVKKQINYSNRMWFSIWASALIIGLFLFINVYTSPETIWFVYPTFAILWWPLTMVFSWLGNRKK